MNPEIIKKLRKGLSLSIYSKRKDGMDKTASIALSKNGNNYVSGNISSETNLLDITSEQACLMIATQHNDFNIDHVITMLKDPNPQQLVSPLAVKIIKDHSIRVGKKIRYSIIDENNKKLFDSKNIDELLPFYRQPSVIFKKIKTCRLEKNYRKAEKDEDTKNQLKKYALKGIDRALTTYDSASGYGACVLTDKNNIYFSGQYSSFDKRLNIHAEMGAVISSLMSGKKEKITHLGLTSTKYKDKPCEICGCCRQFLKEITDKFDLDIKFFTFSTDNDIFNEYNIDELLPNNWSSNIDRIS